ncbi:DNA-binding response regulator [Rhodoferax lacus]|uniref:DNA-binding response regulator n=1 Tax=Rhodoferax lacus TaxID=2184758 RepID=A0A3E1R6R2_9BURK|nr:response regulator transcription factor [Rhodoferax lacus]RFO94871.1 DNA-binding response regulator [Rhodoferax lacus]
MIKLFLVDDHQIMREGLRVLLQTWGYQVVGESADLTQALAAIQKLQPDVLLLDLHLGDRSGLELLAELQSRNMHTRCVVLSMLAQPNMIAEALRLGALGYVLKGSAGRELATAIEAAASGQRFLGPEVSAMAVQSFTQPHSADPVETLSPRERQVISMVVQGLSSATIGSFLHLSPKTVATYRSRLMAKLNVKDVPALVRLAIRHKMFEDGHP